MRGLGVSLSALMFGLICSTATLAQSTKVPVLLSSTVSDNDPVGRQLVAEIQEAIRGSQGFRLVDDSKQWPYIRYSIVTIWDRAQTTAAAHVFTYDSSDTLLSGAFITTFVQVCGRGKLTSCARSSLSALDDAYGILKNAHPALAEKLR